MLLAGCSTNSTNSPISNASSKQQTTNRVNQRHAIYLKGVSASRKGDYKKAVNYFQEAAKLNHFMAKNELGVAYIEGKGVAKDYKKAFYLFKQVVDQAPDPISNYNLGHMYRLGMGVKKDYAKAINNYKVASDLGHIDASLNLGNIYNSGYLGMNISYPKAFMYFRRAAKGGEPDAINSLGTLYEKGLGVVVNKETARSFYNTAAAKGNSYAMNNLGDFAYKAGDYKQARRWFKKAAHLGNKQAIQNLSVLGAKGY